VLQDLGFAGKPHPDIFIQNEPETVFEGLETFQKAKGLKVDGAVKNKDSETGIALNKAMAEFYNPEERGPQPAANQEAQVPKPGLPTKPKLPAQPEYPGADRPAAPAGPYLPDGSQKPVLPPKPQIKPISGGGHQQFIGGKWVAVPILGSHDAAESLPLGSMYQIGGDVFRRR
tara:strand:+ start:266 stop:784 length:519 start_codon:yes stop_codon:yes gene_type:complete